MLAQARGLPTTEQIEAVIPGRGVYRFVRDYPFERQILDAVRQDLVADRDRMFCDRCGDCPASTVRFADGLLCLACAAGLDG